MVAAETPTDAASELMSLQLPSGGAVSAVLTEGSDPSAMLVLAHGAGAGMRHRFMAAVAAGLAKSGVSVLRYQFPYMEAGSKRPDRPQVAHAAVRSACAEALSRAGKLPLFAGGKSFGARMTSQAQSADPLAGVRGLVFFGFPLHPAGKPALARAQHLSEVSVPMLFLQGTSDALAEIGLIEGVVADLGPRATLSIVDRADHSFHVPARSGRTDDEAIAGLVATAADWMRPAAEQG